MITYFDNHFNKSVTVIYPGECYVPLSDEIISTVLGSCVTVALFDQRKKIGGINHFMLAQKKTCGASNHDNQGGRFGDCALKNLLQSMYDAGCRRDDICAKVFGGGNVLKLSNESEKIGDLNIKCAIDFLSGEGIPIIASDVGGVEPRKIYFESSTAKVWLKRIENSILVGGELASY